MSDGTEPSDEAWRVVGRPVSIGKRLLPDFDKDDKDVMMTARTSCRLRGYDDMRTLTDLPTTPMTARPVPAIATPTATMPSGSGCTPQLPLHGVACGPCPDDRRGPSLPTLMQRPVQVNVRQAKKDSQFDGGCHAHHSDAREGAMPSTGAIDRLNHRRNTTKGRPM